MIRARRRHPLAAIQAIEGHEMTKRSVLALCTALAAALAGSASAAAPNPADDPRFYRRDPHETVISSISAWAHPTKQVFAKHHLKLVKVELMLNGKFPVFHVADFGADPAAGPTGAFFSPILFDLLRANGYNALKIVEDSAHDGFVVAYDRKTRSLFEQLVQGEKP